MQQNMRPITKPDLNSVFESMLPLAKSNPQYINAYLLTGTPEQKLAAAMIKDMPQSPTLPAQTQAPTQTVIDQKLAQAEPGIASLPVAESMFDGGTYAAGGIIAFEDGGDVPRYANLGEVKYPSFGGAMGHNAPIGYPDINSQVEAALQGAVKQTLAKAKAGLPLSQDEKNLLASKGFVNPSNAPTAEKPQLLPEAAVQAPQIQKPLAAKPTIDPNKRAAAVIDPAAVAPTDAQLVGQQLAQKPTAQQMQSAIPLDLDKRFGLSSIDPAKYLPKKETMTDIEKEQADAYARAGVTDKPYEAGLKDLISRREKLAKSEEQAPWMALAKAGFAMASGKSQFGLQNLAEGAGVGLADLTAAKDKLETRRDQLEDKEQAYTLAQNQYMQNRTDANLSRVRSSKDKYETAQQSLEVANNNIQNESKKLALNVELEKIKLNSSNFNAAQSRELQRLQLEKPDAFSVMLEAVNSDPALKTKMQRAERLVEMTKKAASGSEGYTLQASIGKGVDDMFKDRSTPLGKLYSAIANNNKDQLKELGYTGKTGLNAANAYKDTYRQQQLNLYGPRGARPAAGGLTYNPETGALE
jgi:hypothetical protein